MNHVFLTLAYADVFDYPFTREELNKWLIFGGRIPVKKTQWYFLRNKTVAVRNARSVYQNAKWQVARRAARILSRIPSVQLVGVTGALSMNNAKKDDDIDVFVIAKKGTLWSTRLSCLLFLTGMRRTRNDTRVANKICLNMFMTDDRMEITDHDLFTAHEVLQMQPLFDRKHTYRKFLNANTWVKRYLPNAWKQKNTPPQMPDAAVKLFIIPEPLARTLQRWYMRRHTTNEVITDTVLRFHPKDARVWVKRKLAARLGRYNIPLDKIFYAG